jgi:MYXO-CTERM domain-containing protein
LGSQDCPEEEIMKRALLAALLCCALVAVAQASVIYSTGFESPTFTTANLDLQNGWDGHTFGTPSAATVQTAVTHAGSQAVKIDATPIPSSAWYLKDLSFNPVAAGTPIVTVEWWMRLDSGSSNSTAWGVDVYGSDGNRVGYMQVDSTNNVRLNNVATSTSITRGAWYDFKMVFDYTAHTYQGFVNGTPVGAAAAMPAYNGFGDADLAVWGAGYDKAYFDDYSIVATPEPASFGLLALGALTVLRRRANA